MRIRSKFLLTISLVTIAFSSGESYAQSYGSKSSKFEPFLTRGETTFSISTGLRNNKTDWSNSSDITGTATPNTFLEQTFRDVSIIELKAKARHVEPIDLGFIQGGLMGEAEITGGAIVDGFSQLSSYAGDNRTNEVSRQSTNDLLGDAIAGAVTVGYKINLTGSPGREAMRIINSPRPKTARGHARKAAALQKAMKQAGPYVSITPLVGYGIDQQGYRIENVFEVIPAFDAYGTDADYVANWYGPFFGIEAEIKNQKHMFRLRGQYHDLSYDATFTDHVEPKDVLEQEADGTGITLSGEYAYALGDDYAFTIEGLYQHRETDPGTEKQSFGGATPTTVLLHEIDDESQALRVGFRYNWD